jgi:ribosomal protein S18 acetylase RimI-like enzyme
MRLYQAEFLLALVLERMRPACGSQASCLPSPLMKLLQAETTDQIEQARLLFREYESSLGISLCFQNFEKELAELPGAYAAPDGRLLLANYNDELAGCVALRRLDDRTCEMKRLFVREKFRGKGIGRSLIETIIRHAQEIGYKRMLLDTLPPRMNDAIALYRSIGFRTIAPYYDNPVAGAVFMELTLR